MALPKLDQETNDAASASSMTDLMKDNNLILTEVGSNIIDMNGELAQSNKTLKNIESLSNDMKSSLVEFLNFFKLSDEKRAAMDREASLEAKAVAAAPPTGEPVKAEEGGGGGIAGLIGGLAALGSSLIAPLLPMLKRVGNLFKKFLGPIFALFEAFEGFLVGFSEGGDIVTGIREAIANVLKGFLELPVMLGSLILKALGFDKAAEDIEKGGVDFINKILDYFRTFFSFVTLLFKDPKVITDAISESFNEFVHDTIESVKKLFFDIKDTAIDSMVKLFRNGAPIADAIGEFVNDTIETVKKTFFDAKDMLMSYIANTIRSLSAAIPTKLSLDLPIIGKVEVDVGSKINDMLEKAAAAIEGTSTNYQKKTYTGGVGAAIEEKAAALEASKTGYVAKEFEGTGARERFGAAMKAETSRGGQVRAGEGAAASMMGMAPSAAAAPGTSVRVPEGKRGSLDEVTKFFVDKGFSPEQAAGIAGNLMQESSLNPNAINKEGGGQGAHGIAQWRGDRWTGLQEFAKSRGTSPYDLYTQLEYIMHELNTREKKALDLLKKSTTAEEAARNFSKAYERAGAGAHDEKRVAYANQALQSFSKAGSPEMMTAAPMGGAAAGTQIASAATTPPAAAGGNVISPTVNNVSMGGGGRAGVTGGPTTARDTDPSLITSLQNVYAAA